MVSSIVPGTSAGALGVDPRYARPAPIPTGRRDDAPVADRVELTGASLAAARDSVRDGLMQVHQALAVGHDAQAMLVQLQAMIRDGASQDDLDTLLSGYRQRVEAAVAGGARLAAGEDISIQAEPNAPPVVVAGVDLRLDEGPIALGDGAQLDDPTLPQAAQRALDALQEAMSRLLDSARALEAHQGFLGAAAGAAGVRHDLDADAARLLALQVRQGLEDAAAPIANIEPQAVLSLFRA